MLGLPNGIVRLVMYIPEWQQYFEQEKCLLQAALGDFILDIQHVGSTSIPGMIAKPIIDIDITVANYETAWKCILPIERVGFEYKGDNGIPRSYYFVKGEPPQYHLHIYEAGSTPWQNQIFFRDYLIEHHELAWDYAELKMKLAERYPEDRPGYLAGKSEFIEWVLRLARVEYKNNKSA